MNHGPSAGLQFFQNLQGLSLPNGTRAALFAPATALAAVLPAAQKLGIAIGAQNIHWEKSGAFTGELSAPLLTEIGVSWALVGHSERRQFFGESDETVWKRTATALRAGFTVVTCVGELLAEREAGQTNSVLSRQIRALTAPAQGADQKLLKDSIASGRWVIAYEPVWAIGTGKVATPEQAQAAHAWIRSEVASTLDDNAARGIPLLYGGSVTPENFAGLLAQTDIDGGLVGGASLKAESFRALVSAAALS